MDAAPHVKEDQNFQHGDFAAESREVDAYWGAHLTPLAVAPALPAPVAGTVRN
jgi:hypothetical protein